MFCGSAVAFWLLTGGTQMKSLLARTQYFSAGILIAAIGLELMPKLMTTDSGLVGTLAEALGFFGGVALMVLVEHLTEGEGSEAEEQDSRYEALAGRSGEPLWKSAKWKVNAVRASVHGPAPKIGRRGTSTAVAALHRAERAA